ncbi:hypothetical protein [Hydrogenivirga sp.]
MTPVAEKYRKLHKKLLQQQRVVIESSKGRAVYPWDEQFSIMSDGRVVLRYPGVIEIYRLKGIRTTKEGERTFIDYVLGECLQCLKLD